MGMSVTHRWSALYIGLLLVAMLVTGCAGIEPYEPRDHREEGPERGLLTGPDGEFIIYKKADGPETGSESGKEPDETAEGEQEKIDGEEKNRENRSGDQQP